MKGSRSLAQTRNTLLHAMVDELSRCYNGFKEKSEASGNVTPYFMAFEIMHKWYAEIKASSGALVKQLTLVPIERRDAPFMLSPP